VLVGPNINCPISTPLWLYDLQAIKHMCKPEETSSKVLSRFVVNQGNVVVIHHATVLYRTPFVVLIRSKWFNGMHIPVMYKMILRNAFMSGKKIKVS